MWYKMHHVNSTRSQWISEWVPLLFFSPKSLFYYLINASMVLSQCLYISSKMKDKQLQFISPDEILITSGRLGVKCLIWKMNVKWYASQGNLWRRPSSHSVKLRAIHSKTGNWQCLSIHTTRSLNICMIYNFYTIYFRVIIFNAFIEIEVWRANNHFTMCKMSYTT